MPGRTLLAKIPLVAVLILLLPGGLHLQDISLDKHQTPSPLIESTMFNSIESTTASIQSAYGQKAGGNETERSSGASYWVRLEGGAFLVHAFSGTGAKTENISLDVESKTLLVDLAEIENNTRTQFLTVTFKSELMEGPFTVLYDGQPSKEYFVRKIENSTFFMFNFQPNVETIAVIGTRVAPEFSFTLIMLSIILAATVLAPLISRHFSKKM